MGEYADDLVEAGLCGWDTGEFDPFDPNIEELEQDENCYPMSRSRAPRSQECRYCKKRGLWWAKTDNGWRLADKKGKLHKCAVGIKSEDVTF